MLHSTWIAVSSRYTCSISRYPQRSASAFNRGRRNAVDHNHGIGRPDSTRCAGGIVLIMLGHICHFAGMWLGGPNIMSTAQVRNGLSRHASCYEVTTDMASGYDVPNAVSTQSNTSDYVGKACSKCFTWWRLSCVPEHDVARKPHANEHESPLHNITTSTVPLSLATAGFSLSGAVRCHHQRATSTTWDQIWATWHDWPLKTPFWSALHCRSPYHFSQRTRIPGIVYNASTRVVL
jgi:hypothetical protein